MLVSVMTHEGRDKRAVLPIALAFSLQLINLLHWPLRREKVKKCQMSKRNAITNVGLKNKVSVGYASNRRTANRTLPSRACPKMAPSLSDFSGR